MGEGQVAVVSCAVDDGTGTVGGAGFKADPVVYLIRQYQDYPTDGREQVVAADLEKHVVLAPVPSRIECPLSEHLIFLFFARHLCAFRVKASVQIVQSRYTLICGWKGLTPE